MKRILFSSIILFANYSYSQSTANHLNYDSLHRENNKARKDAVDKPFAEFELSNDRAHWSTSKLQGKTVYINFWFAACVPCMAEMPQVNELYAKFKGDTNFVFISITFDDQEKINTVKSKYKIEYDIFQVSHQECGRLNISRSYPASIVLDKSGIVRFFDTGGELTKWLTRRYFEKKIYPQIENSLNGR